MKKLILIFGTFAIICVIISAVADSRADALRQTDNTESTQVQSESYLYEIKSENGKIVVYKEGRLHLRTSTAVNTLPKIDQKELLYGIKVNTKEQMNKVLEQYCS
ncbi:MAG: hypothetical protein IKB73_06280 [Ruminococcus sp.]|nr:hypothetical protein [Ruminococcus sp.]